MQGSGSPHTEPEPEQSSDEFGLRGMKGGSELEPLPREVLAAQHLDQNRTCGVIRIQQEVPEPDKEELLFLSGSAASIPLVPKLSEPQVDPERTADSEQTAPSCGHFYNMSAGSGGGSVGSGSRLKRF